MKYKAMIGGRQIEIELKRQLTGTIEAEIDGRSYTLEANPVEPGVYWLNWNNRSLEVVVTPNSEGYVVSLNGRRVSVEMLDSRKALQRASHGAHDGVVEIRAPMPGKVIRLLVTERAEVQSNQGILVMEAMKMQNEIRSPKQGVVQKLVVGEGAAVSSGDLLATVE